MKRTHCPVCRSSLQRFDEQKYGENAVRLNRTLDMGICLGFHVNVEKAAAELSQWVWMSVPFTIELAHFVRPNHTVRTRGNTVEEAIDYVDAEHPGFKRRLLYGLNYNGAMGAIVGLSVNRVPVDELQGLDTPVTGGDHIGINTLIALTGDGHYDD